MQKHKGKFAILAAMGLLLTSSAHAAYADVDAVITAVTGISTSATTVFLAAAAVGVAVLTVKVVARVLKRGVSL